MPAAPEPRLRQGWARRSRDRARCGTPRAGGRCRRRRASPSGSAPTSGLPAPGPPTGPSAPRSPCSSCTSATRGGRWRTADLGWALLGARAQDDPQLADQVAATIRTELA